jgi:hypothetical protein
MSIAPSRILEVNHPQSMLIYNDMMDQLQPPTIVSALFREHGASLDAQLGIDWCTLPIQVIFLFFVIIFIFYRSISILICY